MQATATYDPATGTFTLVKGKWSGTFPVADLSSWLEFYRQQQERYPVHAASYGVDVMVLEALAAEIRSAQT